jgi:predicted glycogen debranching enzyme
MTLPTLRLTKEELSRFDEAIQKEWLITNGLGGYASSTVLGVNTRKYHGLLVAALHPPGDRTVCLSKIDEEISVGNAVYRLGANEFHNVFYPEGFRFLEEFSVSPFPKYVYNASKVEVTKTLFLPHEKNVVISVYRVQNRNSTKALLRLTPLVTCRHFHLVLNKSEGSFRVAQNQNGAVETQLNFSSPKAAVTLRATRGEFHEHPNWIERIFYREEAQRGESSVDDCFQPGFFEVEVPPDSQTEFSILASAGTSSHQTTEILNALGASSADMAGVFSEELQRLEVLRESFYKLHPTVSMSDWLSWILFALDSFVVKGVGDTKSVIAGYHWFEAWGRDTFISLPGLMLVTGRFKEARDVLFGFNKFCTLGLIPNFLSDLSQVPSCNTVDATMWHVNAVLQYLKYTGDFGFVKENLWDSLKEIIENHIQGTSFDIRVDEDGLLAHGPRLTWMDAEVNGQAVTPRAGKAVEIQALWYNALRIMQLLAVKFEENKLSESYALLAQKAKENFAEKFWNNEENCLFDVLSESGPDASVRPNQVIAVSLDFNILDNARNMEIVDLVKREHLTPSGLRTLKRSDPRYIGTCVGDRWSRDQAYHNGMAWPWLLGPFTTSFLKAKGATAQNRSYAFKNFIEPLFAKQVSEACLGTVNEIFDGDPPHKPRGCVSQAWSVAEPLRAYVEDVLRVKPKFEKAVLSFSG